LAPEWKLVKVKRLSSSSISKKRNPERSRVTDSLYNGQDRIRFGDGKPARRKQPLKPAAAVNRRSGPVVTQQLSKETCSKRLAAEKATAEKKPQQRRQPPKKLLRKKPAAKKAVSLLRMRVSFALT
jgi:hypothetical protein